MLTTPVETVARNGDVELYAESFGDPTAPALLLVCGLGSQCIHYRTEWCEQFVAAGFFVIRFDNRDTGLSSKLPGRRYELSDMADDALAVLGAFGVERAHVMGVSMGGMVAQQLAIDHPERVLTLTSAMSTTGDPDVGHLSPEATALVNLPPPADRQAFIERQILASRVWGSPAHFDPERVAAIGAEAYDRAFYPEGMGRQIEAIVASGSRTEALRKVSVPTLVLHGDRDGVFDPSGGERTAEAVPGARFVLLEGLGHDMCPAYWDRWTALVAEHAGLA